MDRGPYVHVLAVVVAAALGLGGCVTGDGKKGDEGKPVVVVLWHACNAVAENVFDDLVVEFNKTVGIEQGIIVGPVEYGSSNELDDALYVSASHVTGPGPLLNTFASYPSSAHRLDGIIPLAHLDDYFSEEELDAYRPEFLKERIQKGGGICRMIPMAEPTEILCLNETNWEWFARDTRTDKEMFKTWGGLARAVGMYYEWFGGSPSLRMNAFSDFVPLTATQLGEGIRWIWDGFGLSYSRDTARRVQDTCYVPHIKGWYGSRTYSQDSIKNGRLTAYISSSADVSFSLQVVTEGEKQYHPTVCGNCVYPVLQNDMSYMGQKGSNMAMSSTDESHRQTVVWFLKWSTESEQSIRFAVTAGYPPVQEKALESVSDLVAHVESRDNIQAVGKSIQISLNALENHNIYVRETFRGPHDVDQIFSISLENYMNMDLETLKQRVEKGKSRESAGRELLGREYFNHWYEMLLKETADKIDGQKIQK